MTKLKNNEKLPEGVTRFVFAGFHICTVYFLGSRSRLPWLPEQVGTKNCHNNICGVFWFWVPGFENFSSLGTNNQDASMSLGEIFVP